jgi:DNA-directed RNA polymerase specialized sigma54-like protein
MSAIEVDDAWKEAVEKRLATTRNRALDAVLRQNRERIAYARERGLSGVAIAELLRQHGIRVSRTTVYKFLEREGLL